MQINSKSTLAILFVILSVTFNSSYAKDIEELYGSLQLLGSISGKNSVGVALVKHRTKGVIRAIRVGEDVFGFGELIYVDRYEMRISDEHQRTVAISSRFGGFLKRKIKNKVSKIVISDDKYAEDGFQRVGGDITIDKRYRDRILKEELPKILMEAASEPVLENGMIIGFRLYQFEPNSMFAKLGIHERDIITAVNGVPLRNAARAVQLLNSLRQETNIHIDVLRGGETTGLDMAIK